MIQDYRRIRLAAPLMALLLAALAVPARAQEFRGVAVSPAMYRQEVKTGGSQAFDLDVQNMALQPLRVALEVRPVLFEDWTYSPKFGQIHEHDCSTWFASKGETVVLPGNSRRTFRLPCRIPRVPSGAYWCMVTVTPTGSNDRTSILTQYQVPIILFVGKQPKPDLRFYEPELSRESDGLVASVPIESIGKGFTVIGSSVQLTNLRTGRVLGRAFDADRNLYPGSRRTLRFRLPDGPDGEYLLQVRPQAGSRVFRTITQKAALRSGRATTIRDASPIGLAGFSFDPGRIRQNVAPGSLRTMLVRLSNDTDRTVTVALGASPLRQNQTGAFEVGEEALSGDLKVEISPAQVTLPPKRTVPVRVNLALSEGSTGDRWFAVVGRTVGENTMTEEIYGSVVAPNTGRPGMRLTSLGFERLGNYPVSLSYTMRNSGNTALLPLTTAALYEKGLTLAANLNVPGLGDGGILPDSLLRNRVGIPPGLKPGAYTLVINAQYAENGFERLSVPFTIGPLAKAPAKGPTKPPVRGKGKR